MEYTVITNDCTISCFQISQRNMWRQDHLHQKSPFIYNPIIDLHEIKRNRIIVQPVKVSIH